MHDALTHLMAHQDGLVNRVQLRKVGVTDADIRRRLRRREWARVLPGVYVAHTGPLTWQQRAWSAVLYAGTAALYGVSALRAADGPGRRGHDDSAPIQVAIDRQRQVVPVAGVVIHRVAGLDARTLWNTCPPRMRVEDAVLDVASAARDDFAVIAVLAQAVQSRRTTAERILRTADRRSRVPQRALIEGVLRDIAAGTCSVLEHAYLTRVEPAHGLPRGRRQVGASSRGPIFRDVHYEGQHLVVELDGRLDHTDPRSRDRDLERDLDAATEALLTIRLGWGQAFERPCSTAIKLARLLASRGWRGRLTRCPVCDRGDLPSPGDCESPRSA